MAVTKLATPPNSRIKPRSATQIGDTIKVEIPSAADAPGTPMGHGQNVTANGNVLILETDENRTVATLKNSGAVDIYYAYTDKVNMTGAVFGDTGFILKPGDSIDIESPEDVFAVADDPANRGSGSIDFGIG